jgi:hypothetical protein
VCGEIRQVVTDQSVDSGLVFGGMAANSGQYALVYAERDILHSHSICVTVFVGKRDKLRQKTRADLKQ